MKLSLRVAHGTEAPYTVNISGATFIGCEFYNNAAAGIETRSKNGRVNSPQGI